MEVRMAFWKGDERTRLVNVWVDGELVSTIQSSAETMLYENYGPIAI